MAKADPTHTKWTRTWIQWTSLINAAREGHTATAAELVRLGADINAKSSVRACEGAGCVGVDSPLCCGVPHAQVGWTALMHAAWCGRTVTAAELARLGADVNAKSDVRACDHM